MTDVKPRWIYRFDNYKRALDKLREAVVLATERPLSELEKIGTIQCFEFTWELAWKTLKDYLEASGIALQIITPATVIREAFAAKIIGDGDGWMRALEARNEMSHMYDEKAFEQALNNIRGRYIGLFETLFAFLQKKISEQATC